MIDSSSLSSYKRMEVDSKTMWSVESIACILRRNTCRGGYKIRKCRTFRDYWEDTVQRSWDIPKSMMTGGTSRPGPTSGQRLGAL
jgi:hypothetical protein